MAMTLRFESVRDSLGYDCYFDDDPTEGGVLAEIRARGGQLLQVALDETAQPAFELLTQINRRDPSEIGALCDGYGFPDGSRLKRYDVEGFREAMASLLGLLDYANRSEWPSFEREANKILGAKVRPSEQYIRSLRTPGKSEPQLVLVCSNLFRFAALQLCEAVAGGHEIKKCPSCEGFFAAGGSSGRKKDGIYCSTRCRVAAHRAKK